MNWLFYNTDLLVDDWWNHFPFFCNCSLFSGENYIWLPRFLFITEWSSLDSSGDTTYWINSICSTVYWEVSGWWYTLSLTKISECIIFDKAMILSHGVLINFAGQKMKFSIKDIFGKCDQIHSYLWIWSHLLKKSLIKNFIFCAVFLLFNTFSFLFAQRLLFINSVSLYFDPSSFCHLPSSFLVSDYSYNLRDIFLRKHILVWPVELVWYWSHA